MADNLPFVLACEVHPALPYPGAPADVHLMILQAELPPGSDWRPEGALCVTRAPSNVRAGGVLCTAALGRCAQRPAPPEGGSVVAWECVFNNRDEYTTDNARALALRLLTALAHCPAMGYVRARAQYQRAPGEDKLPSWATGPFHWIAPLSGCSVPELEEVVPGVMGMHLPALFVPSVRLDDDLAVFEVGMRRAHARGLEAAALGLLGLYG